MKREHLLFYLSPALLASLALGYVLHVRQLDRDDGGNRDLGEDTYREVMKIIEEHYVDDVDREELVFGAVKGMADVLDRHSRGYTPEEWSSFSESSEGRSHGIGVRFGPIDGWLRVFSVFPRSPAARAGLRPGDRIIAIDGRRLERGTTLAVAKNSIVGEAGTPVEFEVESWQSTEVRTATISRGSYGLPSVQGARRGLDGRVGYLRVSGFTQTTAREFRAELRDLMEAPTDAVIIDLRDNPGGSLQAAVAVVSAFIETDRVLTSVYRQGSRSYATLDRPIAPDVPLAVLINEGSASASEIVAGALQDFRRAIIVGEHSYGKGLVQKVFSLATRSTGVKITTARWLTPSGRTIQREHDHDVGGGVLPDLLLPLADTEMHWVREQWSRIDFEDFIVAMIEGDPDQIHMPVGFADRQLDAAVASLAGAPPTRTVEN